MGGRSGHSRLIMLNERLFLFPVYMRLHLCRLFYVWLGAQPPPPSLVWCCTFLILARLTFLPPPRLVPFRFSPQRVGVCPPVFSGARRKPAPPSVPMQHRARRTPSADPPPMPRTRAGSRRHPRRPGLLVPWRATAAPPGGCRPAAFACGIAGGLLPSGNAQGGPETSLVRRDAAAPRFRAENRAGWLHRPAPRPRPVNPQGR